MKRMCYILMLFITCISMQFPNTVLAEKGMAPPAPGAKALILYDVSTDEFGKLGITYAIMMRNLLGHFSMAADLVPVNNYVPGSLPSYTATFYLGSNYNNPIPITLMDDISTSTKPVVWFKYNLWEYAWDTAYNFTSKYGFSFNELEGLDGTPTAANPNPGFYDTVSYKGMQMSKYYTYNSTTNTINADPDIGSTTVTDANKAQVITTITDSKTNSQLPYIIRSGNFWYFADLPLTYIGPRDRYLVLCDILHDILGINHPTTNKAMVRLEDVSAAVDPTEMKTLVDYLSKKKIKFSIATIPYFLDPMGDWTDGVPEAIPLSAATNLKNVLNYAIPKGGAIVMHGYTHQYDTTKNPWTGVSADDFEFWNIVTNSTVLEDSTAWASGRLTSGLAELEGSGYTAYAWETPHYQASPTDYQVFATQFKKTYQRAIYYSSQNPDLNPLSPTRDFMAGMFFPYIIESDYYGQRIIPENLGNVEYDISKIDPSSYLVYTAQDIITNAKYALVVRDGYASFFFHPFWLDTSLVSTGYQDFQTIITGITQLGYTWVRGDVL